MSTFDKTISVIVPVYNAEKYLQSCIDSVKAQTYGNWELILIDDCSKDGSYGIIEENAEQDSRIKALKNDVNSGVSKTRNRGIKAASGEYIAFLDSDDMWDENKLKLQAELLAEGVQFSYSTYDFIDEDGKPMLRPHVVPGVLSFKSILKENIILCSTVCVEASLLKEHLFRSDYYHEDYVLWLELFRLPIKIQGRTESLTHYRISRASRSYHKGHAARERWRIYRDFLKFGPVRSAYYFGWYALYGIKKYYT